MSPAAPVVTERVTVPPGRTPLGTIGTALGGSARLLRAGAVDADAARLRAEAEPRTVAGVTADGTLLLLAVDGRAQKESVGATPTEAARLARSWSEGGSSRSNLDAARLHDVGGGHSQPPEAPKKTGPPPPPFLSSSCRNDTGPHGRRGRRRRRRRYGERAPAHGGGPLHVPAGFGVTPGPKPPRAPGTASRSPAPRRPRGPGTA
ncbi:phosphodiester glycosidase family protein [Streptomyces sp. DHE17-7]|uniref:phosphodiester glycosidase family protein n=1 Tax=Streptomyces sp. DHE17-7 TaxID=2759949 RepID=UPI0022EA9D64|nr:phosphodiester glycosidase family protein [Streptomyces sp. DHE17-7]MBJ6621903.1 phosphodiester glycosidase family protein [Streptomyces sp. DHE17-7]